MNQGLRPPTHVYTEHGWQKWCLVAGASSPSVRPSVPSLRAAGLLLSAVLAGDVDRPQRRSKCEQCHFSADVGS